MEINKRLAPYCLTLVFALAATAQDDVMRQINDIKSRAAQEHFLTEQMMVDTGAPQAEELCIAGLLRQLSGGYTLDDVRPLVKKIVMDRGTKQLVFVYIDKDDLGAPSGTNSAKPASKPVTVTQVSRPQQKPAEQPVATTQPVVTPKPVVNTQKTPVAQPSARSTTEALTAQQQPFFMQEVMSRRSAGSVEQSLGLMKKQNLIDDYGRIGQAANTNDCYIILFKGEPPYQPIGVLSPVTGGQRLNLNSRQVDALENHRGCGAFWIKLKK